jgi:hypothetical protein
LTRVGLGHGRADRLAQKKLGLPRALLGRERVEVSLKVAERVGIAPDGLLVVAPEVELVAQRDAQ